VQNALIALRLPFRLLPGTAKPAKTRRASSMVMPSPLSLTSMLSIALRELRLRRILTSVASASTLFQINSASPKMGFLALASRSMWSCATSTVRVCIG
jgi:hypothetical protein